MSEEIMARVIKDVEARAAAQAATCTVAIHPDGYPVPCEVTFDADGNCSIEAERQLARMGVVVRVELFHAGRLLYGDVLAVANGILGWDYQVFKSVRPLTEAVDA